MPTGTRKKQGNARRKDKKAEGLQDPYRRNREWHGLTSTEQEEENRSARQRAVKKHPEDKTGK